MKVAVGEEVLGVRQMRQSMIDQVQDIPQQVKVNTKFVFVLRTWAPGTSSGQVLRMAHAKSANANGAVQPAPVISEPA